MYKGGGCLSKLKHASGSTNRLVVFYERKPPAVANSIIICLGTPSCTFKDPLRFDRLCIPVSEKCQFDRRPFESNRHRPFESLSASTFSNRADMLLLGFGELLSVWAILVRVPFVPLPIYWLLWTIRARTFHPLARVPVPQWPSISRTWLMHRMYLGDLETHQLRYTNFEPTFIEIMFSQRSIPQRLSTTAG
ncbi:uncharacterized protein EKO05_0001834 [Ascochyta rabiei]|uniref:uncharacterized protein n=1 Tax=Didymella rabiei TaxID=5454 RepID=UPI0022079120|nr:uncharacterized protein EKO05_0001834 [Ascochyta rabiei]UPX11214.1 hypothetical protein EKO05_0001834 [Ascochyta rabiei]